MPVRSDASADEIIFSAASQSHTFVYAAHSSLLEFVSIWCAVMIVAFRTGSSFWRQVAALRELGVEKSSPSRLLKFRKF